jgi:ATP-dependent Clp protease protease subunit
MKKKTTTPTPASAASEPEAAAAKSSVRNIFLFGRLENEITLPTIKRLLRLDKEKEAPINLYINSAGGNGYNADAIVAVMHTLKSKVNTICLGHALSGACEILASGTGERSSYEFATLMFHQTLWEADGDITNLEIQAAQGRRFREAQVELLHRCTGKDKAIILKDIERDHYMSAEEALKYGIIDKILVHERSGATVSKNGRVESIDNKAKDSDKQESAKAAAKSMRKSSGQSKAQHRTR